MYPYGTVMGILVIHRTPELGDNPQLLGTTAWYMSTPQQPAHDSNPETSDDKSNTIYLSPPSDDNDLPRNYIRLQLDRITILVNFSYELEANYYMIELQRVILGI